MLCIFEYTFRWPLNLNLYSTAHLSRPCPNASLNGDSTFGKAFAAAAAAYFIVVVVEQVMTVMSISFPTHFTQYRRQKV